VGRRIDGDRGEAMGTCDGDGRDDVHAVHRLDRDSAPHTDDAAVVLPCEEDRPAVVPPESQSWPCVAGDTHGTG
jgi:hypothetical protein